jgi:hypothetical protein
MLIPLRFEGIYFDNQRKLKEILAEIIHWLNFFIQIPSLVYTHIVLITYV